MRQNGRMQIKILKTQNWKNFAPGNLALVVCQADFAGLKTSQNLTNWFFWLRLTWQSSFGEPLDNSVLNNNG
jgi:hypothetical protein